MKDEITVRAVLSLPADSDRLMVRCGAENKGRRTILALNYPRLQGIYPADPWRTPQGEDFWIWAEARTTLWGELVVTHMLTPDVQVGEKRLRFLRNMTAARTRFAREWLAYGRLERPPIIDCPTIEIVHGLAEGGWLRSLIFPAKQAKPRQPATPSEDTNWSLEADWEWLTQVSHAERMA